MARGAGHGFLRLLLGHHHLPSAQDLRDVAAFVPMDRLLIETDSPLPGARALPGKTNNPSYAPSWLWQIAAEGLAVEQVAEATSRNFEQLFCKEPPR